MAADYHPFMNDHTYATTAANPAFFLIVGLEALVFVWVLAVAARLSLGRHRMKKQILERIALTTVRVEGRQSGHLFFSPVTLFDPFKRVKTGNAGARGIPWRLLGGGGSTERPAG